MTWKNKLTTVDEVEAVVGRPAPMIMRKQISALDEGCRAVLARSPIAAVGYRDADGVSRTTFIGGTPGFVRVHSPTRISFALPEGEPRGPVSLFFLLPGVGEVLRVNGSGTTTVEIVQAYVHCAQAVLRSRLWQPPNPAGPKVESPADGPLCGPGIAEFLAVSPFLAVTTWDRNGGSDTSPRGDDRPVARILDGRTLLIADRRGNRRADTLHNLLEDDRLSFAALVPGRTDVLHGRGRGVITTDPALLETLALRGIAPHAALIVDVEHAEVTDSRPVASSRMWTRAAHVGRGTVPDLMALGADHLAANTARSQGAYLLKALTALPGMTRLMRLVMDRAYRSGLRKEGYEEVRPAETGRAVRVVEVRRETPTVVTLVLEDRGTFDFRPGQFFTLVADIDGRPVRRAYSACSAPGSSRLEVTVKHLDGGRFSTYAHRTLRRGNRLTILGPSGSFHAGERPPRLTVLVAGGSGVTPMMSIIRARQEGRIALLYSSRSREDVIFADELNRLAEGESGWFEVTHVLTREHGRLDADRVRRWITGLSPGDDTHYYVCGPDGLTDAVRRALTDLGVPDTYVHCERFLSGTGAEGVTTEPQEMSVDRLGTVVVEPGQTLLDAGLAAGLPMPYSCTVGSCGDCMVRLRDGEVTQNGPNCLTPQQRADGYVLTCVGFPLSKVTLALDGNG